MRRTIRRIGTVRLIGNKLVKKGMPRSKAFKKAWKIVKKKQMYD